MNLLNATRMQAGYTMGMEPSGRELIVVAVKGTFDFPKPGAPIALAAEQVPLVEADAFTGDPGFSAPLYEVDYAPRKQRCDVLLNGSAYGPGGQPAKRVTVSLRVGAMEKSFDVVGSRWWEKGLTGYVPSNPEPFVRMPISYNNAFGGVDKSHKDETKHQAFMDNTAGVGFHSNMEREAVEGKLVPNTEEIGHPIKDPRGDYLPMAFGPLARGWRQRIQYGGTYDQNWLANIFPFLPPDFNDLYYQAAPVDQQILHPPGGETVELINLTPEGRTVFALPKRDIPVLFIKRDWSEHTEQAKVDTVVIEPDLRRVMLTWRATVPVRRNIFEFNQIVAGEMSQGWHRARRLGKTYYPSLREMVEDREAQ